MEDKSYIIGAAVAALADCCSAVSGNIHILHLNMSGVEFDTLHKKVTKKYYEQLDNDYDELAEWARCYNFEVQNKNESAARISFQSLTGTFVREQVVNELSYNLKAVLEQFRLLFEVVNNITECAITIGLANWLQDRIQYWAKEVYFFNAKRG